MLSMLTACTHLADKLARIGYFDKTSIGRILMDFSAAGAAGNSIVGRFVDRSLIEASFLSVPIVAIAMAISVPSMLNPVSAIFALAL